MLEFVYSATSATGEPDIEIAFPGGPEFLSARLTEAERWSVGIYLATFPKKGLVVSDLEVRMPFGPEFDARKDDMAWNGNLVATAWKDYLRWIVLDSGASNLLIIREITDTMEALGAGVRLPPAEPPGKPLRRPRRGWTRPSGHGPRPRPLTHLSRIPRRFGSRSGPAALAERRGNPRRCPSNPRGYAVCG